MLQAFIDWLTGKGASSLGRPAPDYRRKVGASPAEDAQDTIALIDRNRLAKEIVERAVLLVGQKSSLVVVIPGGVDDLLHLIKIRIAKFDLKKRASVYGLPDADEYLKDAVSDRLRGAAFATHICDRISDSIEENRHLLPERGFVVTSVTIKGPVWPQVVNQIEPLIAAAKEMTISSDLIFILMICLAGKPKASATENCEVRRYAAALKSKLSATTTPDSDISILVTDPVRPIGAEDIRTWAGKISIQYRRPHLESLFHTIENQINGDVPLNDVYDIISAKIATSWN